MKDEFIIEYCNYGKGYLRAALSAEKAGLPGEILTELDDYLIEDGVIKNIESVARRLERRFKTAKMPPATLLLRCEETYKTILSLPVMSRLQAKALYAREQKIRKPDPAFTAAVDGFHHSLGYVFNTYYMPKAVIDSFKKLARMLGTRIILAEPCGFYLKRILPYTGSYVYFYIRLKVCTMILVSDGELVSAYDFEFSSPADIKNQFLLVASKHEFEFGRRKIRYFGISSDEEIELDLGLSEVQERRPFTDRTAQNLLAGGNAKSSPDCPGRGNAEIDHGASGGGTTFYERYASADEAVKASCRKLADKLLSYADMRYRVTDSSAVFFKQSTFARIDIRNGIVCLYLTTAAKKHLQIRFRCSLTGEKGFEDTPFLYQITSPYRQEDAYALIDELAGSRRLAPKEAAGGSRRE